MSISDVSKRCPEGILYQTQLLFANLLKSDKQYYNPKMFTDSLKTAEGKPINVSEQMDADEFLSFYFDKLKKMIKGTQYEHTIKSHFSGVFANQLICQDCPHSSTREEPFTALNLQIKNKKNLASCLESLVEGELLQGNNAYYCEKCNKTVSALKRVCIKRLPKILICVFKRFEFDYGKMKKIKLNDFCEFPTEINLAPFTQEGISGNNISIAEAHPLEYYEYTLKGVIIHLGTADIGHYYSIIKNNSGKWFEFNDSTVEEYNIANLSKDAFGLPIYDEKIMPKQIKNAYILVYEKRLSEDIVDVIPEDILKIIESENVQYWLSQYIFNEDYAMFIRKISLSWNSSLLKNIPSKNLDYINLGYSNELLQTHAYQTPIKSRNSADFHENSAETDLIIYKFTITYLITILMRAKQNSLIPDFIDICKAYINKNYEAAKWLIIQFTNSSLISEYINECSNQRIRKLIVGLLYCSMIKLYDVEKAKFMPAYARKCVLVNFVNFLIYQLEKAKGCANEQYYQLISRCLNLGPEIRHYFLKISSIKRFISAVCPNGDHIKLTEIQYVETENCELASPQINKSEKIKTETNIQTNYVFLIEALGILLRTTTIEFGRPISPLSLQKCQSGLGMDPVSKSLLLNIQALQSLLHNSKTSKIAVTSITLGLAHLSWENAEFKNAITKAIIQGLNTVDYEEFLPYFEMLRQIIKLKDSSHSLYLGLILGDLFKMLKKNENFYYATFYSISNLINITKENKFVADWLGKNIAVVNWINDWLNLHSNRKEITPYKSNEKNNKFKLSDQEEKEWKLRAINLLANLNKIREGNIFDYVQTDGCTLYYSKLFQGQVVEY